MPQVIACARKDTTPTDARMVLLTAYHQDPCDEVLAVKCLFPPSQLQMRFPRHAQDAQVMSPSSASTDAGSCSCVRVSLRSVLQARGVRRKS